MRFSLALAPKDPLWKLEIIGSMAENIGVDGLWLSEHPDNRNSILTACHLLKTFPRLWIGIGVLNPYMFHPLTIAQVAATLSEIAPRRVYIGVGAGDRIALEKAGIRRIHPLKRVERCVMIVREILEKGSYWDEEINMRLNFRPRSMIPIYIGAQGRRMLRLAGRIGDGVLVNHTNPELLESAANEVRIGANEADRRMEEIDLAAYLTISIGEDESKALKAAAPYSAYIICGAGGEFIERLGIDPKLVEEVRRLLRVGDWVRLYQVLPPDYIKATTLIGGVDELRELVARLLELGYTQIVFGGPFGPRVLEALRMIGEVVKYFEEDINRERILYDLG